MTKSKNPMGRPPRPVDAHAPCVYCLKPMKKRSKEKHTQFAGRRFCSHGCWNKAQVKPEKPHAPCAYEGCGRPVLRRYNEAYSKYHARQCCSPECVHAINSQHLTNWFAVLRGKPHGWPDLTESNFMGRPFSAFDCDPGDGGPLRISRAPTFVSTEASS